MNPADARVVYASMEIALGQNIPTYSGGLGALSGDTARVCADMGIPAVFFSLMAHNGYFKQVIDENGWQHQLPDTWNPKSEGFTLLPETVDMKISGRDVKVKAWEKEYAGAKGETKVYLLDTKAEGNSEWDRKLTDRLYDGDGDDKAYIRMCQEAILGIGTVKMARALGYTNISTFHMNDCHPALVTYALLEEKKYDADKAKELAFFTTHTPVEAGFDSFSFDKALFVLGAEALEKLRPYASYNGNFNMAHLALKLSRGVNAVSKLHAKVCKAMDIFNGHDVFPITNGVHAPTWVSEEMGEYLSDKLGDWQQHPEVFLKADKLRIKDILAARKPAELRFVQAIKKATGVEFDPEIPIIGFGRRAATYKQGDLDFLNVKRFADVSRGNFQVVYAMKAHPSDDEGKKVVQRVWLGSNELRDRGVNAVFLDDYNLGKASDMVMGSVIWKNNPERPKEACGTSGMKVLPNGGLNLSVLDGWWHEAYTGYNGWAIAPENLKNIKEIDTESFYHLLQNSVGNAMKDMSAREFLVRNSMKLAAYYNTRRMVNEYAEKAWKIDLGELEEKKHFAGFSLNGGHNSHNGNGSRGGLEKLVGIIKSAIPSRKN